MNRLRIFVKIFLIVLDLSSLSACRTHKSNWLRMSYFNLERPLGCSSYPALSSSF